MGKENVKLSSKQIDELIELIDKEEILEVEDKIEKALQKDKEAKIAQSEVDESVKAVKEKGKDYGTDEDKKLKDVSSTASPLTPKTDPTKCTKLESTQTMVTPPPSIDKTKDSSKML